MHEFTTTATVVFKDGSVVEIDEELPFRVHIENAARLPNVASIQSANEKCIHFFNA